MTNVEQRLAEIFGNAEAFGQIDPKYAEVMHGEVWDLITGLNTAAALLNAELNVAKAEIEELEEQRVKTRLYLGIALGKDDERLGIGEPVAAFRDEVKRIIAHFGLDRKIQCIKELRSSDIASAAWEQMGNGSTQGLSGSHYLGLKEAKDVIDAAVRGYLWCGSAGRHQL